MAKAAKPKEEVSAFDQAVEQKESAKGGYVVIQRFRDRANFDKIHEVDDPFTGTPEDIKEFEEANLIKKV